MLSIFFTADYNEGYVMFSLLAVLYRFVLIEEGKCSDLFPDAYSC